MMEDMIKFIKQINFTAPERGSQSGFFNFTPKIIAGNVATPQAVLDLQSWGADAAKVGIAGGKVCSTKTQTGFHVPMFTCMLS